MQTLKNKILIKLIFIISILMIISLNLFGEDKKELIRFEYYYYTNKIYHSTLKTEIIPSEYVFINTYSNEYRNYENEYSYLYNLKTKEKKLFYIEKGYNDASYKYDYEYYDINSNMTTNWTDENMRANGFYEITNNRFGETFYTLKFDSYDYEGKKLTTTIRINKDNDYIQKAYKYSLTQPEIINKKDRGIYLFDRNSYLCFQNEYYENNYDNYFEESGLLNYNSNGRVKVYEYPPMMYYSFSIYNSFIKQWVTIGGANNDLTNTVYFQLDNKSLIKPTWDEFTNDFLNYIKPKSKSEKLFYTKEDIKENLQKYNNINATKYLGFIPIEEFEYYLLAD
ncbi:hypothetical protein EPJ70_05400 [Brachyspira aalborgi]|uniref:Uncharacterized protein n=1 Tax=Brachyspira aalborgi TaxID=29522 RepID=A0A5C8F8T3_9SPIR|nr:hypothetical protein [Brachyspira aalborgi]TXJ45814.1 hypothetical protein EPJ70_05400 [Brachyspira aalborgi]